MENVSIEQNGKKCSLKKKFKWSERVCTVKIVD